MIHDNIGTEMVQANIIVELNKPTQIDVYNNICKGKNAACFKVTYNIMHPNYLKRI